MPNPNITKQAFSLAIKSLMETTSLYKISINDICRHCGVSRTTFYYHFEDKLELVNWIFYSEIAVQLDPKNVSGLSYFEIIERLCTYLYENHKFYINALSVDGQNSFINFFIDTISEIMLENSDTDYLGDELKQFFIMFFIDGFVSSIFRWLKSGPSMTPREFVSLLEGIINKLNKAAEE